MLDLFGNEIIEDQHKLPRCKIGINYRLSENRQCCKNCSFLLRKNYHNKIYYKCEIIGDTNGHATDVKLKCVCDNYERFKCG